MRRKLELYADGGSLVPGLLDVAYSTVRMEQSTNQQSQYKEDQGYVYFMFDFDHCLNESIEINCIIQ